MFNYRWLFITALYSFSAFSAVNLEEKKERIEYLEELSKTATSMNIEAFRRELKYEVEGLTLEKRAENEALLLAEKVKAQVFATYEEALKNSGDAQTALDEVREAIEKDLMLVDESLQEEMRELAMTALDNAQRGEISGTSHLQKIQESMLKGVKDRSEYLNQEFVPGPLRLSSHKNVSYNQKSKILASLVSDDENMGRPVTSNTNLKSTNLMRTDSRINLQVKVDFLGISVEAGPVISFKRQYVTNFDVLASGLHPALDSSGSFDFMKRNKFGNIVVKNGKKQKREISFACEAAMTFSTEYSGSGGFSVMGMGSSVMAAKDYANSVNLISRRIEVPESLDGKIMDYKSLAALCHNDFLNARITSNLTVANSLNIMMKNIISGLSFSHPKTKCAVNSQCNYWYNNEIISFVKRNNVPRCVEHGREKYFTCELRGMAGQKCPVYNNKGRRISDGRFEFTCDAGLRCATVREASFFSPAFGKCVRR